VAFVHLFYQKKMQPYQKFEPDQIAIVNNAVAMSEELVCNHYKLSVNQWLRHQYDVKTLADLTSEEIVDGPLAQIVRYQGQKKDTSLGSSSYDFYKICLQDHSIIKALEKSHGLALFPFSLYIITHELIHIVRFSRFLVHFNAMPEERITEEARVHEETHTILKAVQVGGLQAAFDFYKGWRTQFESLGISEGVA